jgi:hypothetical protein
VMRYLYIKQKSSFMKLPDSNTAPLAGVAD